MGERAEVPEPGLLIGGKALFRNGPLGRARTPSRAGQATLPQAKTAPAAPA